MSSSTINPYVFTNLCRFSEAAELIDSRNFFIQGHIKTKMLSPDTSYAAYLVFGISDKYAKLHSAVSIIRSFNNETEFDCLNEQATIVQFQQGSCRGDAWLEIKLGDFYVGSEAKEELQVQLLNTSRYRRSGLIVEGLEFRPCI